MKKSILISTLVIFSLLMLLSVSVNAGPTPPYSISGDARLEDGTCVSGFNIKAKAFSPTTGGLLETDVPVNENCEYSFVLGGEGTYNVWYTNMRITLTFCDVSRDASCAKTIIIGQGGCESGGGCIVNYNYKEGAYTPDGKPIIEYINRFICWDGSTVSDSSLCSIQPQPTKIVCQDGTIVDDESKCLETDTQVITYVAAALGASAITYALIKWSRLVRGKVKKGKRSTGKKMVDTYIRKRKKQ